MKEKPRNVAFLPYVVAGHPIGLARAVEQRGFNVQFWILEKSKFEFGNLTTIFDQNDKYIYREIKRLKALVQVLRWAHIIHCSFGSTLAGHLNVSRDFATARVGTKKWIIVKTWRLFFLAEIKLYKLTRKKLVIDFQGDDIRQSDIQLKNFDYSLAQIVDDKYYDEFSDLNKRWKIKQMTKSQFSFHAITPDLLNYLPEGSIYLPEPNVEIPPRLASKEIHLYEKFRIIHAPSNRRVKGTKFLIDAVRELQTEGYKIELEIIEGIENKDAVHLYSRAHLAVDQLRTGWYGRFAVECLSRGVPVISYIRQSDLNLVPFKMAADLPILNANETTLKEMIRYAITLDKEDYENLRRKSFDYVATWHNVQNIADSLIRTYLRE